jgi:RNA polymerase sigma-70 factor (ECF subfamily)
MHRAIEQLGKIDKAIVTLYLEDYDYKTIGEMLGISANNVAVKMTRIRVALKELMEKMQ